MISGGLRVNGVHKHALPGAPLITVVTVVRNGEATLEETILSVLNQTYRNVEYIVVDGASIDGTLDIIRKYEDRIDYWVSESDGGIYDAMNKSLGIAEGDWMIFLGADDVLYDDRVISAVVPLFTNNFHIYYGDVFLNTTAKRYDGKFSLVKLLYKNISHQAIFYPRSVYKSKSYLLEYKIWADYYYNLVLFRETKFVYIDAIITRYNESGFSSNTVDTLFLKDRCKIIVKHYGIFYYLCYITYKIFQWLRRKIT